VDWGWCDVKRVFVLSRQSLFHQGIETLLTEEAGIEIVGQDTLPCDAVNAILTSKPDVVILNLDDPEPDLISPVLCVLRGEGNIRVIGMSLKNNNLSVFQGENKEIKNLEDLFNAILN
jgi:DNA-binding NarL/FixJ family response regulator